MSDNLVIATLSEIFGDQRSQGFDDLIRVMREYENPSSQLNPDVKRLLRFMQLFSIAAVEGGREASLESPEALPVIIHAMCMGASIALCSAILSTLKDDITASALRTIVSGSFEQGITEVVRVNDLK